jgi:DNA-binding MarR family transcriptional regulator
MHQLFDGTDALKELAVILAIADFKRPGLSRFPSLAYLAFLAGLDEPEFDSALKRLERKGYIDISGNPEELEISLDKFFTVIERATNEPYVPATS